MRRLDLSLVPPGGLVHPQQRSDREQKGPPGKQQGMSKDERQRMREDMRDVYRDRNRQERPQQQRQMSPQEREKLRRDIQDANRDLKR